MGMIDTGATTSVIADTLIDYSEIKNLIKPCTHNVTVANDRTITFDQEISKCKVLIEPSIGV